MPERPYPEGIAWDEAWLQRQRADELERRVKTQKGIIDKLIELLPPHTLLEMAAILERDECTK